MKIKPDNVENDKFSGILLIHVFINFAQKKCYK